MLMSVMTMTMPLWMWIIKVDNDQSFLYNQFID